MRWRIAVIVLAGVLAYANSLSGPFIFDDEATIVENTSIHGLSSGVLFPRRELPTAGRPVVNLSFAINYALDGLNVRGYRATNLAIHLLCGIVLFGLVRRTLDLAFVRGVRLQPDRVKSVDIAFAIALIWTLHPLNTEAVDYLTQRTESMMALFYLLTMFFVSRPFQGRDRGPERPALHGTLAVASCALGMACKEPMVTAPVMVLLYDRIFVFDSIKKALRERWLLYAGLAATWIVLIGVLWSGPRVHSAGFSTGVTPWTYLLNQTVMITRYLRLAVWPRSLVLAYGTPQPVTLGDVLPYAIFVVLLLAATGVALWRRPMIGFLGAWVFITLAPTSSVVPIATEVGAERRMYLGLAAVITLAVIAVSSTIRQRTAAALLGIVCVALATGTVLRNREYESPLRMAQTMLERWPSGFAHTTLGIELAKAGRHDEAIAELREAAPTLPKARYHLGGELFSQGQLDEAVDQLHQFLEREPYMLEAVQARTMIGRALLTRHKYADAMAQLRLVLSMTPGDDEAHLVAIGLMGDALLGQEQFDEAIRYYRGYLSAHPSDSGGLTNLGIALSSTGRIDEGIAAFRRAVDVKPDDLPARRNLAKALFNKGDLDGAAAEARAILRIRDDADAHDLLGRALGSQGKLEDARMEFERALKIDPRFEQAREDLALLKKGKG